MEKIIVKKEEENNRIDAYLSTKIETASRVTIQRLIEEGKILVNNKKTKASYKIQEKDGNFSNGFFCHIKSQNKYIPVVITTFLMFISYFS